jgi:acyl carrier protein
MIRHLVLLQPKADSSDEAMTEALAHVETLRFALREIMDVQVGKNQSQRHQGYTYCFEMRFSSQSNLEASMAHPAHQEVSAELRQLCQHTIECDLVETPPPARKKLKETIPPQEWQRKQGEERLRILLMDQLDVTEEELIPSASFVEDLNADSLDLVELFMGIEEEFQVTISDQDAEKVTTVGEALAYLEEKGVLEQTSARKK